MSWTKELSVFTHGILVTPIILVRFTHQELSFWYLLQIMVSFGLLSEAGFAHTLQRAVAFFFAGAKKLPRNLEEYKNSQEESGHINFQKLKELLYTVKGIYLLLSVITLILLGTIGLAIMWKNISDSGHRQDFWLGYIFMVVNAFFAIQSLKWSSFMMGTRHVAELNGFRTIMGAVRIIGYLAILIPDLGLEYLMLYLVVEIIFANIYYKNFIKSWFRKNNIEIRNSYRFSKEIFNSLWSVTWKSGLNTWGFFFTQYGVSLIIAQINDKVLMANFLFTQRMLSFIRRIAEAPVIAHFPRFYSLMAVKNYKGVKNESSPKIFLSYALLIAGFVGFGLFGNILLDLIKSDKRVVETSIYILICVYMLFEWNALIHGTLYISTNAVPFLIPGLLTGAATLGVGFLVHPVYGVLGLVIMQVILNMMCNFWFSTFLSLRLIKWPFHIYLSNVFTGGPKYWIERGNSLLKRFIN